MQIKNLLGLSTEEFFTPVSYLPLEILQKQKKKLEKPFEAKITVFSDPYFDKDKTNNKNSNNDNNNSNNKNIYYYYYYYYYSVVVVSFLFL